MNFLIVALAALVPLVIGFIWYNPKTFGNVWMKLADMTDEKIKGANMPVIFILSYVLSFLFAMMLQVMVVHQFHIFSILAGEPDVMTEGSAANTMLTSFMEQYGDRFRTFKHGAFHGVFTGLLFIMPVIGTNALFERKSWKYIWLNSGYWIICAGIMGGLICQFT
jgi:hypothetical protein